MRADADPSCLFCRIAAGELPADRVYEDDEVLAFMDIHPQAPFHCLISPKTHVATLNDFSAQHGALLGHLLLTAKQIAAEHGLPGVAVTDAHTVMEVGVAYTVLPGDPSTAAGMLAALADAELVRGRASYVVRLWTPVAKLLQQARGNGRGARGAGA